MAGELRRVAACASRCPFDPANPGATGTASLTAGSLAVLAAAALAIAIAAGPAAPSASASSCPGAGAKPGQLSGSETRRAITCLINQQRAAAGQTRLDPDGKLRRAAQRHNNRMDGTGCFAHQCPGEADLGSRLRNVGYTSGASRFSYAENVAWGPKRKATPARIVRAWMGSSSHRGNILGGEFRDIGVGVDDGTPTRKKASGGIYTVDFGLAAG
jgi:uncharacterized protein YkwD